MSKIKRLTHERLTELLDYDHDTGVLTWRTTRGKAIKGRPAGYLDKKTGYLQVGIDRTLYLAHRLAWMHVHGAFPQAELDHKNRIGSDNRLINLRIACGSENNANKPKPVSNSSGFKGVSWHVGARKWQAGIKVRRKGIGLGLFETPEAAHAAYCSAAVKYFGEFARFD